MDKNKLILPITILLASIILGGFYYASETNKQKEELTLKKEQLRLETEKREAVKICSSLPASNIAGNIEKNYKACLKTNGFDEPENSVIDQELFQKKQECKVYQNNIEQKIKSFDFSNENVVITNFLDEAWFSPTLNTCLYSLEEWSRYLKDDTREIGYSIYDYLENKIIYHTSARAEFQKSKAEFKQ
ncbi:hypothetical protein KKD57_03210 [Patescibacteria group bacterium]|nr:hypothetical protein [Patescibacteria group bacterium]